MTSPLQSYHRLVARVDAFQDRVLCRYGGHIRCGPGCSTCCQNSFTVFPVEAWSMYRGLARLRPADVRDLLKKMRRSRQHDSCPVLEDDRCILYPLRPLICRTQGLPLLVLGEDGNRGVRYCERNFVLPGDRRITLSGDCVLDLEVLNEALVRVNLQFVRERAALGRAPLPDRVPILEFLQDDR